MDSERYAARPVGFVCQRQSPCSLCDAACEPGQRIFAVKRQGERGKVWVHLDCAIRLDLVDARDREVCKHWRRKGSCAYGDLCQFRHPVEDKGVDREVGRRTWGGTRRLVRNAGRAGVFRRFLLDEFGPALMSKGSGVIDVGGGHGEVSFQLENLSGIPATVLDPRDLKLMQFVRKFNMGMYHRNHVIGAQVSRQVADGLRPVKHLPLYIDPPLLNDLALKQEGPMSDEVWKAALAKAMALKWSPKGLAHEPGSEHGLEHDDDDGDCDDAASTCSAWMEEYAEIARSLQVEVTDAQEARALLRNASLVVGMHPDQATEPLVDLALCLGVPFAVVPCCVYSKHFPRRRLKDGTFVSSYDHLVQHLVEKAPERIRTRTLDFEGKNKVVFWTG